MLVTGFVDNSCVAMAAIERQMVSSYDPYEIKAAIIKLWRGNAQLVIEKINRNVRFFFYTHLVKDNFLYERLF